VYKFKREDIIYFTPTLEYMKASMKEKDVAEGTNFDNKQSRLITSASLSGLRSHRMPASRAGEASGDQS